MAVQYEYDYEVPSLNTVFNYAKNTIMLTRYNRLDVALLILAIILMLLPAFITLQNKTSYPMRDSYAFMYMGDRVLEGEIPYRDVWDHKAPLIFYINAFGLAISSKRYEGIFLIQAIIMIVGGIAALILLQQKFGRYPARTAGVITIYILPQMLQGGNLTEQYALAFQFITLVLFDRTQKIKNIPAVIIGFCGAMTFLLRPNLIAIWLAIGLFWLIEMIWTRNWRRSTSVVLFAVVGGVIPIVVCVIYFAYHQTLDAALDAILTYNIAHTHSFDIFGSQLTNSFLQVSDPMLGFSVFICMPIIYVTLVVRVIRLWKTKISVEPMLLLMLFLFPLDTVLVNASGRSYPHYFMNWLPLFCLLLAFIFKLMSCTLQEISLQKRTASFILHIPLIIIFTAFITFQSIYIYESILLVAKREQSVTTQILHHIDEHMTVGEPLLIWGAESELYLYSGHYAPTRFFYQYPLSMRNYDTKGIIEEFTEDIIQNPPIIIVDTHSLVLPSLTKSDDTPILAPYAMFDETLEHFLNYVQTHYQLQQTMDNGWQVYIYKEKSS